MIRLTDGQRDAILRLGDPESDIELISIEALKELLTLGLVKQLELGGRFDFTDLGEVVYDELRG